MTSAALTPASQVPVRTPTVPAGRRATGLATGLTALRTSGAGLLTLALVVGVGAGLGAVAFRWLIGFVTRIFTGHQDYAGLGRVGNPHLPALGPWFVVGAPVVAGLLYGPLVHVFAREARGHGVPEVMFAVARRGGRIAPQVAVVKALASALCIGGGGSVGREGPIVQIGSALGSTLARVSGVSEERTRVLVACGAAGGIAATFNAPLAGVFFAMELILGDFAARSFGMVVIAAVTSSVIGRAALGDHPFLQLPVFAVHSVWQYLLFAALGLLAGAVGVCFTRVLYAIEDLCDHLWRGPEWLRPAVGGLALGGLLLVLPQMYGVGYPVLEGGVAGRYAIGLLVLLLLGKIVATSLTIGIGGSGGVFAPSLFVGAMLGAAYGQALHAVAPQLAGPPGAYALIGMGAVFAGAARAPITAVVIMFELTGEYTIILPLMSAIVLATSMSHLLSRDTVYTLKLRRRGIDLEAGPPSPLTSTTIGELLEPAGVVLAEGTSLVQAAGPLSRSTRGWLPVVADDERLVGTVSAAAVAAALEDESHRGDPVSTLTVAARALTAQQSVDHALDHLADGHVAVPVVDDQARLIGWVTHQRVLALMSAPPSPADGRADAATAPVVASTKAPPTQLA
jgi:CIC family chloride channel protein